MIDYSNAITLKNNLLGKIKGHTRIELTNVRTGRKNIFEHENTFQSAVIAKQLKSVGKFAASPWSNSTWRSYALWRNLVGGILLFKDEIDLTGGAVAAMPAGNEMVANGSYGVTNSGAPSELGSFNSIESSISGSNSITLVYDWGTSQGNGTISCVCLTGETGGYIGFGNGSGSDASTKKNLFINQSSNGLETSKIIYNNAAYSFSLNIGATPNNVLTITKTLFAIDEASIFDDKQRTSQISFNRQLSYNTITQAYDGNGKVLMIFGQQTGETIADGSTIPAYVLDLENETLTDVSFTNNAGRLLGTGPNANIFFDGIYACFPTYASGTFGGYAEPTTIIKISDGTVLGTFGGTGSGSSSGATGFVEMNSIAPGLFYATSAILNQSGAYIYDAVNKTARKVNSNRQTGIVYDKLNGIYLYKSSSQIFAYKNPLYLATVNNLDTAVTKDSTQTMKVTYTLTEAS